MKLKIGDLVVLITDPSMGISVIKKIHKDNSFYHEDLIGGNTYDYEKVDSMRLATEEEISKAILEKLQNESD